MSYRMMSIGTFIQSYDRDILDLQEYPDEYTIQVEIEIKEQYPDFVFYDSNSTRVWPVSLLKDHFGITGEPLWPELLAAS